MRMIPSHPLGLNESRAELRVFDQLRSAFEGTGQSQWFALHSLNLPRHAYKRFGEIDFLVCGPQGLFVLEVKGGGVACRDGVWETRNRDGITERLGESPFRQAESALHGLRGRLPAQLTQAFVVGYGVVTPDVDRLPESAEWERPVLADARDFRQFEPWLERLIQHWRGKDKSQSMANDVQLDALRQQLRPDFEAVVSLHTVLHAVESRIAHLTEDQMLLIDAMETNPRVVCSGGAGTGKTMLALELAKRWAAQGLRVALACSSPWLKAFLERHAIRGVTVCLAASAHLAARRAGGQPFDALVVDEGQDILNMDTLTRLEGVVHGGLRAGRWCFFHDVNNQSGLCGTYAADAYAHLQGLSAANIPLRRNCRNAMPILRKIQLVLQADLGSPGVGDGPAVREIEAAGKVEAVSALERELRLLLEHDGLAPGDIVLLSPVPWEESSARALPKDLCALISVLDETSPRNAGRGTVGYAEIGNFKGLESEAVVLIDLPRPDAGSVARPLYYVGMSRARALLCAIWC